MADKIDRHFGPFFYCRVGDVWMAGVFGYAILCGLGKKKAIGFKKVSK